MTPTPDPDRDAGRLPRPRATSSGPGWLDEALALARGARAASTARRRSWLRLGDACLQVVSSGEGCLDELEGLYRDCLLARPHPDSIRIRCHAARLPGSSRLWLSFEGASLPDPMSAAGTPFRVLRHLARYAEVPGPAPGWRMLVEAGSGRMLVAGDRRRLVVDLDRAPAGFATDCVVSLVQGAQRDVLFLHAASFGVAGAGALLIGCGKAGKSTTALALAERGHAFLGDDLAAVRIPTRELLPFPRVLSLRPGPSLRSLAARLRAAPHTTAVGEDGVTRTFVGMRDLFPASAGGPMPLRFAFLLDGFGASPRLTRYRPGIADATRLRAAVGESIPCWGMSPGRDLMKFLSMVDVLSRVDCHLLELGTPEDSAAAIEELMEAPCRST